MLEKSIAFSANACKDKLSQISKKPYIITVMESVVIISDIDPDDKDLMIAEALLRIYEKSCTTLDEIETEFGARIKNMVQSASVSDVDSVKKLPLKIKMLVFAQKLADLRALIREYNYYNEELWGNILKKDPAALAEYYYSLADVLFEFEEYSAFSEFNTLVARLFVKHR